MPKNPKQTGKKAGSDASKILRSPYSSKTEKRVAGSDLSQRPLRNKRGPNTTNKGK